MDPARQSAPGRYVPLNFNPRRYFNPLVIRAILEEGKKEGMEKDSKIERKIKRKKDRQVERPKKRPKRR